LAVGWYLRFSLSYRDVEELLAERGVHVDHVTVWRWVQRNARKWNDEKVFAMDELFRDRKLNNIHLTRSDIREHLGRSSNPHRSYRTLRDGSFWGAPSQALRARLRLCSPSGTFAGSSHTNHLRIAPPKSHIRPYPTPAERGLFGHAFQEFVSGYDG
jgi:hypothetical protein